MSESGSQVAHGLYRQMSLKKANMITFKDIITKLQCFPPFKNSA